MSGRAEGRRQRAPTGHPGAGDHDAGRSCVRRAGSSPNVRDTATGRLVRHSYLAAFDRATGAWISTFRPQLDGTVWDLTVANGRLVVAGQFTNINGVAGTSALVALDPRTGQVDTGWRASLAVSGTTARPLARALDVEGEWIYVGGNFTQVTGAAGTVAGRSSRSGVGGHRESGHTIPPECGRRALRRRRGERCRAGGRGIERHQRRAPDGVGTVNAADGAVIGGLAEPLWTTATLSRRYQQAVLAVGGRGLAGRLGAQRARLRGERLPVAPELRDRRSGGRHAGIRSRRRNDPPGEPWRTSWIYTDATAWPSLQGYSRTDVYNWIGAFDATTHQYDRDFVPSLRSAYSEGAWELHTDVDGCVWFGGDFLGGPYVNGQRQYLEGFSKFCPRDTVAPTVPVAQATLATGGVRVTWTPASDDRGGALGYEILRNDRVVSPLVYGTSYTDPGGSPCGPVLRAVGRCRRQPIGNHVGAGGGGRPQTDHAA